MTDLAARHVIRALAFSLLLVAAPLATAQKLAQGDRVMIVGNTFAERLAQSGYLEALVYAAHPGMDVSTRAVPWSADEVGLRPREMNVPTTEQWVDEFDPDVIFAFYAMSESFKGDAGLQDFERDLRQYLDRLRTRDGSPRRMILVSPIAHEDLGAPWPTGDAVTAHNHAIGAYAEVMRRVAADAGDQFIDLYNLTLAWPGTAPYTTNGIHPTELACQQISRYIGDQLGWIDESAAAPTPDQLAGAERLRLLTCDKHYHTTLRYRPTNTEYVWGRRAEPFGVVNFPPEMDQLERMIEARRRAMLAIDTTPAALFAKPPSTQSIWSTLPSPDARQAEDTWEPPVVEAKGTETSLGSLEIKDPDQFKQSFKLADGYAIDCFASEQDFTELANPLALTFDARHRLWVLCAHTYPHLLPGEAPRCKLLILEDTDHDGHADKRTIYADHLYIPTGFAIDTDAVYVAQSPDLLKLTDTDGDDVADTREIVYSGFAMPDSHHQISAFEWTPGGSFLMSEGIFSSANIETPYGTRRTHDAAVWQYDPHTGRLDALSHCDFLNPWGHAFDDYGQSVLADASGGSNYSLSHVISAYTYPRKPGRPDEILNRGRPTAGCEIIASRHFPDDVQGSFLVNQSIGFHGTRWDRLIPYASSWRTENMPQDLLECSDTNFRPVAMEIGPDGALYIVDWCNPIIGHMQYSVRDPRRDRTHGRIWRITNVDRPLVDPPDIEGASIPELLELLRLPERNTRQIARRRLQTAPADAVLPALAEWIGALSPVDPLHDRLVLESLWIHQGLGVVDLDLLQKALSLYDARARAGATRVLRHWLQAGLLPMGEAESLLESMAQDADMHVRLEAVVAAGFLPADDGIQVATLAADHEMDDAMTIVLRETITHLSPDGDSASELVRRIHLEGMPTEDLLAQDLTDDVAHAILTRQDVPADRRLAALEHLAGDADVSEVLVQRLHSSRTDREARAIGELMLGLPPERIAPLRDAMLAIVDSDAPDAERQVALAVAMEVDDALPSSVTDPTLIANALAIQPPRAAPKEAIERLEQAVEAGEVDPILATEQIARHADDPGALFTWLASLVDAVADVPLARWGPEHERAMAALRAMHESDITTWPEGFDRYRLDPPDPDAYARGREIYYDEGIGCYRCHAAQGQGMEGFPPLDKSPWLMGDPMRSASIVVHGLFGAVDLPGGRQFNSTMAPLGSMLDDQQIADVLTFVRRSWGNYAAPVTTDVVAAARARTPENAMWDARSLLAAFPLSGDALVFDLPASATESTGTRADAKRHPWLLAIVTFAGFLVTAVVMTLLLSRTARSTA